MTRTKIPDGIAARALFDSDNTCCVCQEKGLPVQLHHLDEDPTNHHPGNLAVLCLICHEKTQVRGGFGRRLSAAVILEYRSNWHRRVGERRDYADRAAVARLAEPTPLATSTLREAESLNISARESLANYLKVAPAILKAAYEAARPRWDSGASSEMIGATYEVIDIVEWIWVHLASWYPAGHFGGLLPREYFSKFRSSRYEWHRSIAEPDGVGTGGRDADLMAAGGVLDDSVAAILELVRFLTAQSDDFSFSAWSTRWNDAQRDDRGPQSSGLRERLPDFALDFTVAEQGGQAHHRIRAVRLYADGGPTHLFWLIHEQPHAQDRLLDTIDGHSFEFFAVDFDGDGVHEIAVRWACGAHTRAFRLYRIQNQDLKLVPGSEIGSDFPEIEWADRDGDGKLEIYARNVNWSDREGEPPVTVYVLSGDGFAELATE